MDSHGNTKTKLDQSTKNLDEMAQAPLLEKERGLNQEIDTEIDKQKLSEEMKYINEECDEEASLNYNITD